MTQNPLSNSQSAIVCARCGRQFYSSEPHCPHCGSLPDEPQTTEVNPVRPVQPPAPRARVVVFPPYASAILQFNPSAACVTLELRTPIILGRGAGAPLDEVLDLSDFGAYPLGVSRRHCLIARYNTHLTVTDLASANGTFLNNAQLPPNQKYTVAHGDELVLGKLSIRIFFSAGT